MGWRHGAFTVRIRAWQAIAVAVGAVMLGTLLTASPAGASGTVTMNPTSGPVGTTVTATAVFTETFGGSFLVNEGCANPADSTTTSVTFGRHRRHVHVRPTDGRVEHPVHVPGSFHDHWIEDGLRHVPCQHGIAPSDIGYGDR
jgi:hypothetical protein